MNNAGILLLHGFAGNPEEVKPLRDYFEVRGYYVECPLMSGHGRTKKELSKTTYIDWIASAERAYLDISKKCDKVIVVGFSMGGLLAVNLWNYGFAGIVTVNTPIYYWNLKRILINLVCDFGQYWKKYFTAAKDKSFYSMIEFQKLLTKTKPMLGNITCKTLVVQALDDDTVHYKSADYILRKVRAEKFLCRQACGGHMIFLSKIGYMVCEEIEYFIRTCCTGEYK